MTFPKLVLELKSVNACLRYITFLVATPTNSILSMSLISKIGSHDKKVLPTTALETMFRSQPSFFVWKVPQNIFWYSVGTNLQFKIGVRVIWELRLFVQGTTGHPTYMKIHKKFNLCFINLADFCFGRVGSKIINYKPDPKNIGLFSEPDTGLWNLV